MCVCARVCALGMLGEISAPALAAVFTAEECLLLALTRLQVLTQAEEQARDASRLRGELERARAAEGRERRARQTAEARAAAVTDGVSRHRHPETMPMRSWLSCP